jgi:hypothetical protein
LLPSDYRSLKTGIILLQLADERSINKIHVLKQFLASYSNQIDNNFFVVTEAQVRFAANNN